MRAAVCLSGQLRWVEECYPKIYQSIIEPNEADVFFHSWHSKKMEGKVFTEHDERSIFYKGKLEKEIDLKTIDLYKPKKFLLEDQKDFSKDIEGIDISPYSTPAVNQFSMFYSILKSNELKKEYEKEHNFIYDAVIRCRFDLIPGEIFKMENFDLNVLNVKGDCTHTSYCINDHFCISNSENMDVYSDTYNFLKKYHFSDKEPFCPEILLGYGLRYDQNRKINIKTYNWNNRIRYVYR